MKIITRYARHIAIGAALAAIISSVTVLPSAAANSAQPAAAPLSGSYTVGGTTIPSVGMLVPPNLSGDNDFAEHGPEIAVSAELRIGVGNPRNLHVFLCMAAEETRQDSTRVGGCEFYLIFQAPPNECIDRLLLEENIDLGPKDELKFRDTNFDLDVFDGQVIRSFVQRWEVLGDTEGDETGSETGVRVLTHRFIVTTFNNSDLCR